MFALIKQTLSLAWNWDPWLEEKEWKTGEESSKTRAYIFTENYMLSDYR